MVVPTPTPSKLENVVAPPTAIDPVEPERSSAVNLVGRTSGRTPEILTILSAKYIP